MRFYRAGATYRQVGGDLVVEDDRMFALDFSPDGRTIVAGTGSGIVRRFDVRTHQPAGSDLRGHTFTVTGVAYSTDRTLLASTTNLGTTRLWDATTGSPLAAELVAGQTPVTERTLPIDHPVPARPVFSPDGRTLYTPVVDGSIVAWDLRPASWRRAACAIARCNLTRAEWRQYLGAQSYRATCGVFVDAEPRRQIGDGHGTDYRCGCAVHKFM